ncbi:MAG TPA: type I-D CRISPR-associated helicase Cas3', partial [Ktedonobacteraceae bacterium]|nr:type I-D CRISPR-associated helicase Cas3' [Ktedonobacteraceae bacterium]
MLCLHILPVYSEKSSEPESQIGSVRLLRHQFETWEAFQDPNVDVIFNVTMTGDGKSLAGYLPTFMQGKHVTAAYPTNELVKDQRRGLEGYEQRLQKPLLRCETMYGARITELMRQTDTKVRLEQVRKLLVNNGIVLTNPDLVHLIMSHQYGWDYLRKELPTTVGAYFDYFLFDEFHVFGVPQVVSVMNMLGYLDVTYRDKSADRKKFVFLSATPSRLLDTLLERSGLRSRKIEGYYCSSEQDGYRRILQGCDLTLHEISQEQTTEQWVQEHLDEIRDFFKQHKGSKGAILVNSVATARRLVALLKEQLETPYSISIGENTGLTDPAKRLDSFKKDILVGTSTVDIGIDFRINYLIFEAYETGSFLQRFGRLGRHDEFTVYQAHGLVPRFVLERFTQKYEAEGEIERKAFNEVVREVFPTEQEFEQYAKLWGVVQAARVLEELRGQSRMDANQEFSEALSVEYDRLYGSPEKPAMERAIKKFYRLKKNFPAILAELSSFRGLSPLSCGVWDTDDHLQTYDLFFLLANTEFEVLDEEVFMQEVSRRGLEERDFKH